MDEYQKLEAIEERAMAAFDGFEDGDEYTLEQSALHAELCSLFETFTESFLKAEGIATDAFHDIVREHIEARTAQHKPRSADEARAEAKGAAAKEAAADILGTVREVADFQAWAARITTEARKRQRRALGVGVL